MAGRKLAEGCGPCAEAYLDLALRHGATEAEISQARRTSPAASGQPDVP
jgi:AhpD family alkylhydroperoxidase